MITPKLIFYLIIGFLCIIYIRNLGKKERSAVFKAVKIFIYSMMFFVFFAGAMYLLVSYELDYKESHNGLTPTEFECKEFCEPHKWMIQTTYGFLASSDTCTCSYAEAEKSQS